MTFYSLYIISLILSCFSLRVNAATADSLTGPLEFTWPSQRPWLQAYQNIDPCGTNVYTVSSRTEFPLDSGKVTLAIADDIWSFAVNIAYTDEPMIQSDFGSQLLSTSSEMMAGHMCYTLPDQPSNVTAGTNATLQLKYTSQYEGGANSTFYACADITFVANSDFTTSVSCFNVTDTGTSTEGIVSSSSTTAAASSDSATSTAAAATTTAASSSGSSGLSKGAIAGVAVASVIGGVAVLSALIFIVLRSRRRRAVVERDHELTSMTREKEVEDTVSFASAEASSARH